MKVNFEQKTTPNFGRKLNVAETKAYTKAVSEGLTVLDKKLGMIAHNSTVPTVASENTGIGSLLSKSAIKYFVPFLKTHGMTTVQQEPNNLRGTATPSPYSPISVAKNTNMIPLEKLASDEYLNILSKATFNRLFASQADKASEDVDYDAVRTNYNIAITEAYENLHAKNADPVHDSSRLATAKLMQSFNDFKAKNYKELEPTALYEILANEYQYEDWKHWNEVDRNLYDTMPSMDSVHRKESLINEHKKDIDIFMFKQWLTEKEIASANAEYEKLGVKVIADSPIAFTPVEEWQNKDLFIQGLSLGCPPDNYATEGQRWGFSMLKPETIFRPDGTLARGGELMRKRYEKMFATSPGGARIDHIIGLIDPFLYTNTEKMDMSKNAGRLYSSDLPMFAKYKKHSFDEYASIIQKIVIPAAEKYGLTKDDIICEDLGTVTDPVREIMSKLNLGGVSVTEFGYRGAHQPEKNVIMLGSHDNMSFTEFFNDFSQRNDKWANNRVRGLAEDTVLPNTDTKAYYKELKSDKAKLRQAFFTELFTSPAKKIQIFFTDFFGIGRTYNKPGTTDGCWKLRIPSNYEDVYEKNLQNGTALNIPESIANAIRHKGEDFASKHQGLLESLDNFAKILKS